MSLRHKRWRDRGRQRRAFRRRARLRDMWRLHEWEPRTWAAVGLEHERMMIGTMDVRELAARIFWSTA